MAITKDKELKKAINSKIEIPRTEFFDNK